MQACLAIIMLRVAIIMLLPPLPRAQKTSAITGDKWNLPTTVTTSSLANNRAGTFFDMTCSQYLTRIGCSNGGAGRSRCSEFVAQCSVDSTWLVLGPGVVMAQSEPLLDLGANGNTGGGSVTDTIYTRYVSGFNPSVFHAGIVALNVYFDGCSILGMQVQTGATVSGYDTTYLGWTPPENLDNDCSLGRTKIVRLACDPGRMVVGLYAPCPACFLPVDARLLHACMPMLVFCLLTLVFCMPACQPQVRLLRAGGRAVPGRPEVQSDPLWVHHGVRHAERQLLLWERVLPVVAHAGVRGLPGRDLLRQFQHDRPVHSVQACSLHARSMLVPL